SVGRGARDPSHPEARRIPHRVRAARLVLPSAPDRSLAVHAGRDGAPLPRGGARARDAPRAGGQRAHALSGAQLPRLRRARARRRAPLRRDQPARRHRRSARAEPALLSQLRLPRAARGVVGRGGRRVTPTPGLVRVLLSTYNSARFIRPMLDSVLSQTYASLEL